MEGDKGKGTGMWEWGMWRGKRNQLATVLSIKGKEGGSKGEGAETRWYWTGRRWEWGSGRKVEEEKGGI